MTHDVPQMQKLLYISKVVYIVGAALITFFFLWAGIWALDRRPPFEMYEYTVNQPAPGGTLEVHASVRRDLNRRCSVKYTRVMYDEKGRRFWESPELTMSDKAITEMDVKMNSKLDILVSVPDDAPVGKISLITDLQYNCNPIQAFWPIPVVTTVETKIIPLSRPH